MDHGQHFDREMRETNWHRFWQRQLERREQIVAWLDTLGVGPGDRFLDVGSGPGLASLLAAERVGRRGRVVALDRNPEALELLRHQARRRKLDWIETITADAAAMPFLSGAFTHAMLTLVLHHLVDPMPVMKEIRRVLAAGGRLLAADYRPDGDLSVGPPAEARVSARQAAGWMRAAGFSVLEQGLTPPHWFYVLGAAGEGLGTAGERAAEGAGYGAGAGAG
ncbi:MAG: methyltransferase domain-containing protein [Bacillota bacterium]